MSGIETIANISTAGRSGIHEGDPLRPLGAYIVNSFSTNGSGTGAVFEVIINFAGAASVAVTSKGSNYAENDTITIADSQLGNGGGESLTFSINSVG